MPKRSTTTALAGHLTEGLERSSALDGPALRLAARVRRLAGEGKLKDFIGGTPPCSTNSRGGRIGRGWPTPARRSEPAASGSGAGGATDDAGSGRGAGAGRATDGADFTVGQALYLGFLFLDEDHDAYLIALTCRDTSCLTSFLQPRTAIRLRYNEFLG